MSSSKEYLQFVSERLSEANVSFRPMMGEYILYAEGKVVGGIYDDRLLLKGTKSALTLLASEDREAQWEVPYPGAKQMIAADADEELTLRLIRCVAEDLGKKSG